MALSFVLGVFSYVKASRSHDKDGSGDRMRKPGPQKGEQCCTGLSRATAGGHRERVGSAPLGAERSGAGVCVDMATAKVPWLVLGHRMVHNPSCRPSGAPAVCVASRELISALGAWGKGAAEQGASSTALCSQLCMHMGLVAGDCYSQFISFLYFSLASPWLLLQWCYPLPSCLSFNEV